MYPPGHPSRLSRAAEARTFTAIARRLTALVLLGAELDASYLTDADPA
jgi:hypothetical protein